MLFSVKSQETPLKMILKSLVWAFHYCRASAIVLNKRPSIRGFLKSWSVELGTFLDFHIYLVILISSSWCSMETRCCCRKNIPLDSDRRRYCGLAGRPWYEKPHTNIILCFQLDSAMDILLDTQIQAQERASALSSPGLHYLSIRVCP